MLTKTGVNKILQRIWESGGLTEDMEADIKRLKDELDEREGVLRKYGEVYDGEDKDEYEYRGREFDGGAEDYRRKYEDMRSRYINRFFGTDEVKEDYETTIESQDADTRRDGTPQTWNELLGTSREDYENEVETDERRDK